ncbi:MAG TPA: ATP-binding cassette domain-containing protein, partial [Acidimicrobiales bacterium]|nr:ATP-binding cassette domain-containing protein [Acidimicrobiales bacterium]
GILLVYLVGPHTWLGRLFGGGLTDSLTGIVLAQTFVASPFLVVAARSAFRTVDPAQLHVAATLGHGELARLWRVALPVAAPGIGAGMLLAWLRAFGEYGATVVLAYHPFSLPVFTYNQLSGTGLPTTMAPTALALGTAAVVVVLSRVRLSRWRRPADAVASPEQPAVVTANPVRFDIDHRLGGFHLRVRHETGVGRLAVLGPSGSGKTVLLRCLAGVYGETVGSVSYGDRPMGHVAVERRRVGYVAQGFALFPHLTAWQQLLFARGASPGRARYWLGHFGLEDLKAHVPSQLSGGQCQRVALAQALCRSPGLLLLDEPFSALDAPVREELRRELRRLQRETGLATVIVTHDPEEAALLADEIVVISDGRVLQAGPSREVFARPASPDVARLLGIANLNHAVVDSDDSIDVDGMRIPTACGALPPGTSVLWSIRPERVALSSAAANGVLAGTVTDVADVGTTFDLLVALTTGLELRVRTPVSAGLAPGDECGVELPPDAITMWPAPAQVAQPQG